MESKPKRKKIVKSGKEDGNNVSDELSPQVKVRKNAVKDVVKEKSRTETGTAAEVGTTSKRNCERKQVVIKRKRASSTADSGSVQRQVDSELVHEIPLPRKRRAAATSLQNTESLHEEKPTHQLIKKRQPLVKKQHPTRTRMSASVVEKKKAGEEQLENPLPPRKRTAVTSLQNDKPFYQETRAHQLITKKQPVVKKRHQSRMRKSASGVGKKKADKEQLETAAVTDRKKSVKVKTEFELPPVSSPVKVDDKTTIKVEKPSVACTSSAEQSCRKFIGAHVSISGMLAINCRYVLFPVFWPDMFAIVDSKEREREYQIAVVQCSIIFIYFTLYQCPYFHLFF